jgi:kumamolisin
VTELSAVGGKITDVMSDRVVLPGSNRPAVAAGAPLAPARPVEATLVLRRRAEPPATAFGGPPWSRAELAERYGADPDQLATVVQTVTDAGLEVLSADPASRLVRVRGNAAAVAETFGTALYEVPADRPGTRARSGALSVPPALAEGLLAVLGLDDRPQADQRSRFVRAEAVSVSYTPLQLAAAYGFPEADGSGQAIAIIELGGGFGADDLDAYFGGLGLPTPAVRAVGVDGGQNRPGQDPGGADGEVLLDIEVAGAVAPGAEIVVYFAPNSDAGFLDAVTAAAHATPAPTAISISWGQSEDQWTAQARAAMDAAFADAALLGVTVTAAAGDSGSTDSEAQGAPHCDFPAASPHVLGCGGTSLHLAADGSVASEAVWNDGAAGGSTGGGVSDTFPVPSWQSAVGVPRRAGSATTGRGVPDVAGVADPSTGYQVLVDGQRGVIGGTSAVAPLWAGLVARLAQLTGRRFGLLQAALYAGVPAGAAAPGFRDITEGSNGAYAARPGWDPCTGLGVPVGEALLDRLRAGASG